jgi:phosphonate transport system permease protein
VTTLNPSFSCVDADSWHLAPRLRARTVALLLVAAVFLAWSSNRHQLHRLPVMLFQSVGEALGLRPQSEIGPAIRRIATGLFPFRLEDKTDISRVPNLDPKRLPWGTHLSTEPIREYSAVEQRWKVIDTRTFLVDPVGYLKRDLILMLETIEIAIWGTLLALVMALVPAWFGARNLTPNKLLYSLARGFCSLVRALPELITALFFVMIFGFGVIPGVVTLGVATTGFLGKFLADDIENADRGPQEALRCQGANKLKVFRYAILPQVLPSYLAYLQYILERNVRAATSIGVVGAGGIGMELKGRWDMFDFGHVSTTLLVIFVTVLSLERLTQYLRGKLIA